MRSVGHYTIKAAETLGIEIPIETAINFTVSERLLDIAELNIDEILLVVSEATGISKEEIIGNCRKTDIVKARHLFTFYAYDYGIKKIRISEKLNQNHSTTLATIKKMRNELEIYSQSPDYSTMIIIREIEEKIKDLMVEKIIFAALDEERRLNDAS